jgi:hypothetical protein
LLFPVPAVRNFYALELPRGELGITLLIAALGVAALTIFWVLARRRTSWVSESPAPTRETIEEISHC